MEMEMENSTEAECYDGIPSVIEFMTGLQLEQKVLMLGPISICFMTLVIYVINLREAIARGPKQTKGNVVALITIYPIVACSSLISIVVPKAYFFCDTISHISFVIISYQFYRMCINCVEGESNFIAISKDETFSLRAPPCCCCFSCFKKSTITKQKFRILRFLVLQMAVVHVMIFLILNLISIESPETFQSIDKYQSVMNFFAPFIAVTIILGVWGFQITIRTIVPYYSNLKLLQKYSSFQLVLVFCKLQPVLLNLAFKQIIEDCEGVLTVDVKIRTIKQTILQVEVLFLSLWAHSLYKT